MKNLSFSTGAERRPVRFAPIKCNHRAKYKISLKKSRKPLAPSQKKNLKAQKQKASGGELFHHQRLENRRFLQSSAPQNQEYSKKAGLLDRAVNFFTASVKNVTAGRL